MKKDIVIPQVENVEVIVACKKSPTGEKDWLVYLTNENSHSLKNIMIASTGYGEDNQKTSTLRHFFDEVQPQSFVQIELIDVSVFHLTNEYWISYYVDNQMFDKQFVFDPYAIKEENLFYIPLLNMEGVYCS